MLEKLLIKPARFKALGLPKNTGIYNALYSSSVVVLFKKENLSITINYPNKNK